MKNKNYPWHEDATDEQLLEWFEDDPEAYKKYVKEKSDEWGEMERSLKVGEPNPLAYESGINDPMYQSDRQAWNISLGVGQSVRQAISDQQRVASRPMPPVLSVLDEGKMVKINRLETDAMSYDQKAYDADLRNDPKTAHEHRQRAAQRRDDAQEVMQGMDIVKDPTPGFPSEARAQLEKFRDEKDQTYSSETIESIKEIARLHNIQSQDNVFYVVDETQEFGPGAMRKIERPDLVHELRSQLVSDLSEGQISPSEAFRRCGMEIEQAPVDDDDLAQETEQPLESEGQAKESPVSDERRQELERVNVQDLSEEEVGDLSMGEYRIVRGEDKQDRGSPLALQPNVAIFGAGGKQG